MLTQDAETISELSSRLDVNEICTPTKVIIHRINAYGKEFAAVPLNVILDIVPPPKGYAKKYPNSFSTLWVMGATEPIPLILSGRNKDKVTIIKVDINDKI